MLNAIIAAISAEPDIVSLAPFANCTKLGMADCYQGTQQEVASVLKLDPLACKPPGSGALRPGNCSAYGFPVFAGNDFIFKKVELWKASGFSPPTCNSHVGAASRARVLQFFAGPTEPGQCCALCFETPGCGAWTVNSTGCAVQGPPAAGGGVVPMPGSTAGGKACAFPGAACNPGGGGRIDCCKGLDCMSSGPQAPGPVCQNMSALQRGGVFLRADHA